MKRKVECYSVTKHPMFNNFVIGPGLLFKDKLKFIYEKNGNHIEKIIPMSYIGPRLSKHKNKEYHNYLLHDHINLGEVYILPFNVVDNF